MALIANIIWLIFGGLVMAFTWAIIGLLCFISIIFIPWGRACFTIAHQALLPFGHTSESRELLYGRGDIGTGPLGFLGNVLWFIFAGFWLFIAHIFHAFCYAITVIGLPFALAHIRLAKLAIAPIGKDIKTLG
ncbi:YccF domain-containing protein [Paraferrimonas sp. SM1919]|uniref:YccF domain-containing protein n=1 Tax=Paraferrimonas sp. SM1919 TaxID=2662263 RepID=UPI0034CE3307